MAIAASAVWRVRVSGSDLNGAGYDSTSYPGGTDYSQQDAAQASWTNLATSAANSTTVTSASATFTSAMVGNCINLASGTNAIAGFYFITAFTNSTTVTVDRTPATAGALSGGTGKLGGAFASVQRPIDGTNYAANWQVVPGNKIYIRGSGLDNPTTPDYTYASYVGGVSGDLTAGTITFIGENGRPCISCNILFYSPTQLTFQGLKLVANGASVYFGASGSNVWIDCIFDQNGYDTPLMNGVQLAMNCEYTNSGTQTTGTSIVAPTGGYGTAVIGCIFHKLIGATILSLANGSTVVNNIIANNSGNAIQLPNGSFDGMSLCIMNNTIDGNAGHGIAIPEATIVSELVITNNIISNHTGVGKYGIYAAAGSLYTNSIHAHLIDYNVFYNNTANTSSNLPVGSHSTIGVDPGYTNRSTEDLRIGTAMKALGFPNAFKNNASGMTAVTNYEDPGALQRQESAGGLTQAEVYYVA